MPKQSMPIFYSRSSDSAIFRQSHRAACPAGVYLGKADGQQKETQSFPEKQIAADRAHACADHRPDFHIAQVGGSAIIHGCRCIPIDKDPTQAWIVVE
jgi:hypothetical protein